LVPQVEAALARRNQEKTPYTAEELLIIRQVVEKVRNHLLEVKRARKGRRKPTKARPTATEEERQAREAAIREARARIPVHAYQIPISELGLSERTRKHLERHQLTSVGLLMERLAEGEEGLLKLEGIGARVLTEIREALAPFLAPVAAPAEEAPAPEAAPGPAAPIAEVSPEVEEGPPGVAEEVPAILAPIAEAVPAEPSLLPEEAVLAEPEFLPEEEVPAGPVLIPEARVLVEPVLLPEEPAPTEPLPVQEEAPAVVEIPAPVVVPEEAPARRRFPRLKWEWKKRQRSGKRKRLWSGNWDGNRPSGIRSPAGSTSTTRNWAALWPSASTDGAGRIGRSFEVASHKDTKEKIFVSLCLGVRTLETRWASQEADASISRSAPVWRAARCARSGPSSASSAPRRERSGWTKGANRAGGAPISAPSGSAGRRR
jgi:hypothetical protein